MGYAGAVLRMHIASVPLLALTLGLGCTSTDRVSPERLVDVESEELHVGTLIRNEALSMSAPSSYCLEDGQLYEGAGYRLGRVNVFGVDDDLDDLGGNGPVVVFGTKRPGLDAKLEARGLCPEDFEPQAVQMRDDWVAPEGGPTTTRAVLHGLSYLQGVRVRRLTVAQFERSDASTVRVRVRNPFSLNVASLAFVAHYEGGPGKPVPTLVDRDLSLEPGQSTPLEFPRQLDGSEYRPERRGGSSLYSLELRGQLGKARVDIEILVPPP